MAVFTRIHSYVPYTLGDANVLEAEMDLIETAINTRVDTEGNLPMLAELEIFCTSPSLLFTPDESSSELFRIKEIVDTGASYLKIQTYEGTSWEDLAVFPHDYTTQWTQFTDVKCENVWLDDTTPYLKFDGSEVDGEVFRIMEDAGNLIFSVYDTGTSAYVPAITIDDAGDVAFAGDVEVVGTLTTGALDLSLNSMGVDVLKTAVDNELTGTIGPYVETGWGSNTDTIVHAYGIGEILSSIPLYVTIVVDTTAGKVSVTPTYTCVHDAGVIRLEIAFEHKWSTSCTYHFDYVIHMPMEN